MSRWMEYPIGTENVPIDLVVNDFSGGVAGDTPTFRVRRVSDGYYLDFVDQTFKSSGHSQISHSLIDQGDGRYVYIWNSSTAVTTNTSVVVEYTNGGVNAPGVDNDIIVFTNTLALIRGIAQSPFANVGDGAGNCRFVYTLTRVNSTEPLIGVKVYVTSDSLGNNIIAGPKLTNTQGQVEFFLDSGNTYYFWRSKGGFVFQNPDIESIL